jgi:hypothetical protein
VKNEDQVPKRGKLKLGDPRPPTDTINFFCFSWF